jgi:hypothetical protein
MTETSSEPKQPRPLEKNTNMAAGYPQPLERAR